MLLRRVSFRALVCLLSGGLLLSVSFAQTAKRPLNHKDYDGWHTIATARHISADGENSWPMRCFRRKATAKL